MMYNKNKDDNFYKIIINTGISIFQKDIIINISIKIWDFQILINKKYNG